MSILTRVQANPEIGTAHEEYVADLVTRVKQFITDYCRLPRFPELGRGFSQGGPNPATDLTAFPAATLRIAVNGSAFADIALGTACCTDAAATAAELQAQIRAVDAPGFDEVAVSYNGTAPEDYFLLKSGRYGEESQVVVRFGPLAPEAARALKLSPAYGGVEQRGGAASPALEDLAVTLTEQWYRRLGAEGLEQGRLPDGTQLTAGDVDPYVLRVLQRHRRLGATV